MLRCGCLFAVLVATSCAGGARAAADTCGTTGYSYAGVETRAPVAGVSALVTVVRAARVTSGHVGAWLNVGGPGKGPHGRDEWLQIGISSLPGGTTELYYEIALPDSAPRYVSLAAVSTGQRYRLELLESVVPDSWIVLVDGRAAAAPVLLPGSHGALDAVVGGESYDGGVTTCNGYAFRFARLRIASTRGAWQRLGDARRFADAGTLVRVRGSALFVGHR